MTKKPSLRDSIKIAAGFAALIWALRIIELMVGLDVRDFAVYPRAVSGLPGILTAPLFHGSWEHLVGNTPPLVLLGTLLVYGYPRSRYLALAGIWLLSGVGVWLFARSSFHFGASGLTHGIFFYLFVSGILRRDRRSAAVLMIAFYMYGGMVMTILPYDPGVSFESHLFGAAAGVLCAFAFRNLDPLPERRRYDWERSEGTGGEEDEEDDIIGDQWKREPPGDSGAKPWLTGSYRWPGRGGR